jgi:hypothetical protein
MKKNKMKTKPLHGEVRFHLSNGKHYMFWQLKIMQGSKKVEVCYFDPSEYQLEMRGCTLINKVNRAKKVHKAGVHNVSGWIKCEEVMLRKDFYPSLPVDDLERVFYNPVKDPYWRRESDNNEFVWDNTQYGSLITNGKQVYVLDEYDSTFSDIEEIDPKYIQGFTHSA